MRGRIADCVLAGVMLLAASAADARVTPDEYRNVGIKLPANATLPSDAEVTDESGQRRSLAELISRPSVLVFADYTCATLCGPIVAFVAAALQTSGLRPNDQIQFIVIGLDPKDRAADAQRMRREQLGHDTALAVAAVFVTADQPTVKRVTAALGYGYVYDAERDQYVHPGAAFVLHADGRVSRVFTAFDLTGGDLRLALVEASNGRIGSSGDQIRLLCSSFDPVHGSYTVLVSRILAASAVATVLVLGGLIGVLTLMDRRRSA